MQTLNQGILIIILSSIFVLALVISFLLFINSYIKRNAGHKIEKVQLQAHFEQTLLQSQLEIREQTMNNIASELHDNIGQIASLIKINLLTMKLDNVPQAEQRLHDTRELVRQLISDLKFLSMSLNGERITQLGIVKGLENEAEMINKTGQFECRLVQEGIVPALSANITTILFRMSQEILNNIVKHSGSKTFSITMRVTSGLLILAFQDDGVGFDLEEKLQRGGSGLSNLQKRARLIDAQLSIQSAIHQGTRILIELPI